jgi:dephospho-CoA kinase
MSISRPNPSAKRSNNEILEQLVANQRDTTELLAGIQEAIIQNGKAIVTLTEAVIENREAIKENGKDIKETSKDIRKNGKELENLTDTVCRIDKRLERLEETDSAFMIPKESESEQPSE